MRKRSCRSGEQARHRYRIVDVPGWTRDPAIRHAFPFMARTFDGEHEAEGAAYREKAEWRLFDDAGRG